jgi:transcriptional regulator with XRE-family HTH domain
MGEYGDKFNMAVASELRAQRARVQITFDELAERTGLAKNTVLNYLNGKRAIPMPAFAELCRALDISQRVIFETAKIIAKQH